MSNVKKVAYKRCAVEQVLKIIVIYVRRINQQTDVNYKGSSINYVTVLGRGAKRICGNSSKAFVAKSLTMMERGVKVVQNCETSFNDVTSSNVEFSFMNFL